MKLTKAQERSAGKLTDEWQSAYELRESLPTLEGLVARKVAERKRSELWSVFLPMSQIWFRRGKMRSKYLKAYAYPKGSRLNELLGNELEKIMDDKTLCSLCGEGHMTPRTENTVTEYRGQQGTVALQYAECDVCGSEIVGDAEGRANKCAILSFREENATDGRRGAAGGFRPFGGM